tara:strand:+ start:3759 stop:4967 length:1209 start_codon:yes stop_codon:yes gene_type:complete
MKKILIIPDSTWGTESGHRSTQFLAKSLASYGMEVALFTSDEGRDAESEIFLDKNNISSYSKIPYRSYHQFFNFFALSEFKKVMNQFQPEHVLYFGAINNKIFTEYLIKKKIPYYYLPLTTEFYCLKDFAGLDGGTCKKCIHGNYFHALINNCIPNTNKYLIFIKKAIERIKSKKRIIKADKIIAYSNSQLDVLQEYGADIKNSVKTPIFFDASQLSEINTVKGDYFAVIGQCSIPKGWHLIPEIIRKTKGLKFKLIIYKKSVADLFIKTYKIQDLVDHGTIEIVSNLQEHKDVLDVIGSSKAVIVPSIYPTTGEFSLLESIGLSKPVLVFDAGIHKDIFVDRDSALISRIGDVDKFSKDIMELSTNENLWNDLSSGAKRIFTKLINFDDFDESLKKILKNK